MPSDGSGRMNSVMPRQCPQDDSEDKHLEQTHQDSQPSIEEQVISVESTCLIEKYIDLFLIIREDNIFTGQGPVS